LQSHLLGVKTIFIGYRNDDEQVVSTEYVEVESLGERQPKAPRSIDQGYRMLAAIKEQVALKGGPENAIWLVQMRKGCIGNIARWNRPRSDKRCVGMVPTNIVQML